jgi:murein DD-endopeptidase MepM/ murein hydrolase activator NlpD
MRRASLIMASLTFGCAWVGADKMPWTYDRTAPESDSPGLKKGQGGALADVPAADPTTLALADDGYGANDVTSLPLRSEALDFAWPIAPTGINSLYGERRDPLDGAERFHAGVDLDAPYGSLVYACATGVVSYAGWNRGHGRQVIIEHAGGYQTIYSHLSQVLVFVGNQLTVGAPLGRVGNSGRSTGPHLHLEITRYGEHLDPLDLLGRHLQLR